MKYITENEVNQYLPMLDAINILEEAFSDYASGNSTYLPRSRLDLEKGSLVVMPGYFHKYKVTGLKTYVGSQRENRHVIVFSVVTGEPIAMIESSRMGQLKTGALPAMVTRKLLKGKKQTACIIGSGFQAEGQLEGLDSVFDLETVNVYSRNFSNAKTFSDRMASQLVLDVKPKETISEALKDCTIVSSATNSNETVIHRRDLGDSYHVNLVGANIPIRREADNDVLVDSQLVVVEDMEQAKLESSEIVEFNESNSNAKCMELKDLFLKPLENEFQRSVFKSMGVGLEDVAAATALLKNMKLL